MVWAGAGLLPAGDAPRVPPRRALNDGLGRTGRHDARRSVVALAQPIAASWLRGSERRTASNPTRDTCCAIGGASSRSNRGPFRGWADVEARLRSRFDVSREERFFTTTRRLPIKNDGIRGRDGASALACRSCTSPSLTCRFPTSCCVRFLELEANLLPSYGFGAWAAFWSTASSKPFNACR